MYSRIKEMSVEGSRFAHAEGRTCLVYRGTKVCTVGMDGEMRVWAGKLISYSSMEV